VASFRRHSDQLLISRTCRRRIRPWPARAWVQLGRLRPRRASTPTWPPPPTTPPPPPPPPPLKNADMDDLGHTRKTQRITVTHACLPCPDGQISHGTCSKFPAAREDTPMPTKKKKHPANRLTEQRNSCSEFPTKPSQHENDILTFFYTYGTHPKTVLNQLIPCKVNSWPRYNRWTTNTTRRACAVPTHSTPE
jgi:hypothetical protein